MFHHPTWPQGWHDSLYILSHLSNCTCYIISYGQLVFFLWQINQQYPVRVLRNHFSHVWILVALFFFFFFFGGGGIFCAISFYFILYLFLFFSFLGGGGVDISICVKFLVSICLVSSWYSSSTKPLKDCYKCVTWSHIAPSCNRIVFYITGIPWRHITIFWTSYLHISIHI